MNWNKSEHKDFKADDISSLKTDAVLWDEFKAGNYDSFSVIYRNHVKALYSYGMQIAKDTDLVEDCIQDLFVNIWDRKGWLGKTDNIKFYLFKALRRDIISKLKLKGKVEEFSSDSASHNRGVVPSHEYSMIMKQTNEGQQEKLSKAMEFLTKRQKEAIYLRFHDNLSFQEVADNMSLSLKATYNLISKTVDILRLYAKKV